MPSSSSRTARAPLPREIKVLVAAAFIIAIGFGIIAPLLPQYAASFNASATAVAAVVSVFGLTRLLFAPLSGRLTNRLGETPVYMTGVLIVAASMFLIAFAQTFAQLLAFRAIGGVGSTLFTVSAMAFLARKAPPSMRGRVSGAYASAFLIGNIVGPIVGSALAVFGYRAPFLIYGTSLVIAAALVFFMLKDTRLADRAARDARPAMPVKEALENPSYRAALVSFFANGWATFGVRNSVMPLFAASAFAGSGLLGWQVDGALMAGLALSVFALGNVVAVTFSSRLSDMHGRKPLILTGLLVMAVTTGVLGWMQSPLLFLLACLVSGAGTGVLNAPQQAAIADVVGQGRRSGAVMSSAQMSADLGAIIGPLLAGLVVDAAGYGWAFVLTGGVILLGALAWWRAPETNLPVVPGGPRTGALPKIEPEDVRPPHREDG
ncbi:MFS transporter [Micrococcus endophyticus]|uniref:MFS family permease n=1 Tax=Micrococcus endophyticus TaxID=455343 RepID=A0A7W9MZX1_9MICC|nr:MFS transporter [Micrococcus endophyticus]MBB5848385.1 MFS family permease [Micrococcus endophyticus]